MTSKEDILLDPGQEEEAQADSSLLVAYMPSIKEVTQVSQNGKMEHGQVLEVTK